MKEHIMFIESASKSGKTKVIQINSKFDGSYLGEIKWKPTWRCYCFFPCYDCETYWSYDCLCQLTEKMRQLDLRPYRGMIQ